MNLIPTELVGIIVSYVTSDQTYKVAYNIVIRNTCKLFLKYSSDSRRCKLPGDAASLPLNLLKYLCRFVPHNKEDLLYESTYYDMPDNLQYLCESSEFTLVRESTIISAARSSFECFKYLQSKFHAWIPRIIQAALESGNIKMLRYIYENRPSLFVLVKFSSISVTCSAKDDELLESLNFCMETGVNISGENWTDILAGHHEFPLCFERYLGLRGNDPLDGIVENLIDRGKLLHLKVVRDHGYQFSTKDIICAIASNRVDVLEYFHKSGVKWEPLISLVAYHMSYECLKYVLENGCPWNPQIDDNTISYIESLPNHYDVSDVARDPADVEKRTEYLRNSGLTC